jgi:hypothetical protein
MKEHRLRVFDNAVLSKIFGPKRDEVTGEWRRLHARYSPNIIHVMKSTRMKWTGHIGRMGERRGSYRVLVRKPEGKRPPVRLTRRWKNNIKIDPPGVG